MFWSSYCGGLAGQFDDKTRARFTVTARLCPHTSTVQSHVLAHECEPEPSTLGCAALAGANTTRKAFENSISVGVDDALAGVLDGDPHMGI